MENYGKAGNQEMNNQLTEKDIKKMEEELEYRKLVVRKEAIEAVKEARAQGDLSENFEYHAAKKEKNLTFDEWDRMTNIENRGLAEANADIDRHNAACEERRRFLDYQMRNSGVNLAGAVQANSRSRALQALSVDCASQLRRLVDDRDRIADELRYLREKERTGK